MFSGCTVPSDSKDTELGSSNQEASPSAGKNTGVVLVPCSRMEVHPYSYFWWYGCHLLRQMSSQWGSQKLLQGLVSHELTAYLHIFNLFKLNELWPYYQKHINQIILNRTTIYVLALQIFKDFVWILLIANLSFSQTLQTFLLCVRQAGMTQLILAISPLEVIFF